MNAIPTKKFSAALLLVAGALLGAADARAHVTIEQPSATAGRHHKVVLTVTHGCKGSPTRAVSVYVPAGYRFAKARAKPGWTVSYERVRLPAPVELHGRVVTETTALVRWEGGPLPNDQFDEFALQGQVAPEAEGPLPFRVVQTCDKGVHDWKGPEGSEEPAPVLEVLPAGHEGHHHH